MRFVAGGEISISGAVSVGAGAGGQNDEEKGSKSQDKAVEAEPGTGRRRGLESGSVVVIPHVFDGGEGELKPLRKLDASYHRERDEVVEERHGSRGAEEEERCGSGCSGGGDLRRGEMGCLGDGDGGDGLHGLDGHRDVEEEACGDVVESSEDESGGEIEIGDESQGQDDGDEGAKIPDGAGEFRGKRVLEAETTAEPPASAGEKRSGRCLHDWLC